MTMDPAIELERARALARLREHADKFHDLRNRMRAEVDHPMFLLADADFRLTLAALEFVTAEVAYRLAKDEPEDATGNR